MSDAVRDSLIETLERPVLVGVLGHLDADDLMELTEAIPEEVLAEVLQTLPTRDRNWLQTTLAYSDDQVGRLMSQDVLTVRVSASSKCYCCCGVGRTYRPTPTVCSWSMRDTNARACCRCRRSC